MSQSGVSNTMLNTQALGDLLGHVDVEAIEPADRRLPGTTAARSWDRSKRVIVARSLIVPSRSPSARGLGVARASGGDACSQRQRRTLEGPRHARDAALKNRGCRALPVRGLLESSPHHLRSVAGCVRTLYVMADAFNLESAARSHAPKWRARRRCRRVSISMRTSSSVRRSSCSGAPGSSWRASTTWLGRATSFRRRSSTSRSSSPTAADGVLRGFYNVCRHRAGQVALSKGNRRSLQCRYHGWTYGLDGTLRACPEMEDDGGLRQGRLRPAAGARRALGAVRVRQPRSRRCAADAS